jgi:hypothetical protein
MIPAEGSSESVATKEMKVFLHTAWIGDDIGTNLLGVPGEQRPVTSKARQTQLNANALSS